MLSVMPSSSSLSSSVPTAVVLDHAVRIDAQPGLAFGFLLQVGEDVHPCRVPPAEERLVVLTAFSMNFRLASRNSPSTVSIRLIVSGPVSSIFWVPSAFASSTRGPYFFLNSGSRIGFSGSCSAFRW